MISFDGVGFTCEKGVLSEDGTDVYIRISGEGPDLPLVEMSHQSRDRTVSPTRLQDDVHVVPRGRERQTKTREVKICL